MQMKKVRVIKMSYKLTKNAFRTSELICAIKEKKPQMIRMRMETDAIDIL